MSKDLVLVTGATGFIAKHIIVELLRQGFAVRGTVRDYLKTQPVLRTIEATGSDVTDLSFAAADLEFDDGWDAAAEGVKYVIHTADAEDVVRPAREGTMRVMLAAHRNAVKRVVLTSSTVAVMYPEAYTRHHVFSEEDFTSEHTIGITPYIKSKTVAEKAAWNFVRTKLGAPELAVINPGFVQGPALDADLSTSHELYRLMARGVYPAAPRIRFPVCDVRDVAAAHAAALTSPKAAGERFIIANGETGLFALGQALAAECPDLKSKVPKFQLPDTAVRGLAIFDKRLRTILPELGRLKKCTNGKAQAVLGLTFRDSDTAIRDAIRSMRDLKLI
jgi:dihydroflavonol-4-reductase